MIYFGPFSIKFSGAYDLPILLVYIPKILLKFSKSDENMPQYQDIDYSDNDTVYRWV